MLQPQIISAIADVITATGIIGGGIFAFIQWNNASKIKKAEFLKQIIFDTRFKEDYVKAMRVIDYDGNWYDDKFHNGNDNTEYLIDKYLSCLNYICYLKNEKVLSDNEFIALKYTIDRTCQNPQIKSYLWNLYHFCEKLKTKCSFQYLIDYGIKTKKIDRNEFENKENKIYKKHLNF